MKYCHSCGLSIGETATFCATCGALVPVEASPQPDEAAGLALVAAVPAAVEAAVGAGPVLVAVTSPPEPAPADATVVAEPVAAFETAGDVAAASGPVPVLEAANDAAPSLEPVGPEPVGASGAAGGGEPSLEPAPEPETVRDTAQTSTCRLCGAALADGAAGDAPCADCVARLDVFVVSHSDETLAVSLANGDGAARSRITAVNAIYSAVADEATCPECLGMDGRETTDIEAARGWAPNVRCSSHLGCRCAVFFEHECLADGEKDEFIAFAAERDLRVTADAVAAFHEEQRLRREEVELRLRGASKRLSDARGLEKSDPQQAVALYRKAIDGFMTAAETPLDEQQVRHELPFAFNRLTIVLKGMGQEAEALDEIERVASLGVLDRDDCGRKSDREALTARARRLRERLGASVGA